MNLTFRWTDIYDIQLFIRPDALALIKKNVFCYKMQIFRDIWIYFFSIFFLHVLLDGAKKVL
jgi:hypothetical protein